MSAYAMICMLLVSEEYPDARLFSNTNLLYECEGHTKKLFPNTNYLWNNSPSICFVCEIIDSYGGKVLAMNYTDLSTIQILSKFRMKYDYLEGVWASKSSKIPWGAYLLSNE
jgi:hypothetical protein